MQASFVLSLMLALAVVTALPVTKDRRVAEEHKKDAEKEEPNAMQELELSLEYGRYLKEVVQVLESDTDFRKKLEKAEAEDIKSGKIARELHFVDHNVRTKLDELKRRELERLRHYALQEQEKASGIDRDRLKIPVHIDHRNPNRFEVEDLKKLIQQTTHDLEEVDKQRKKEFTEYEMQKEFEYEQKLANLKPEERKKLEEKHSADTKKHKDHPKLHHPGSKPQLEEVWEEQDHMKGEEFDPNSFFHLHDLDGNGVWDENEVKALFLKELDKLYDPNASEDDLMERQEEMERMREHIFTEADVDRDDLISYEEFLTQTRRNEFEQDEGWQGLDEQEMYSQQEYEQYQRERMEELRQQGVHIPDNALPMPHPDDPMAMHPDLQMYHPNQMHPDQMQQVHPNQVPMMHPNQIPQMHPNQMQQMHPDQVAQMQQMHPNQVPQMKPGQFAPNQVPQMQPGQFAPNQMPQMPAAGYQAPQAVNSQPIAGQQQQQQVPQQQIPQQQQQQQQQIPQQQQVPQQQPQVPQQQQQVPHQQQQVPHQQQQVPQQQPQVPHQQQQVPQQQQQQVPHQQQKVPQQQPQVPQQQHQAPPQSPPQPHQ